MGHIAVVHNTSSLVSVLHHFLVQKLLSLIETQLVLPPANCLTSLAFPCIILYAPFICCVQGTVSLTHFLINTISLLKINFAPDQN